MLIDYISLEKLPHWVVWIDWNFHAYKQSLSASMLIAFSLYIYKCYKWQSGYEFNLLSIDYSWCILIGFCIWCVYLAFNIGHGVG